MLFPLEPDDEGNLNEVKWDGFLEKNDGRDEIIELVVLVSQWAKDVAIKSQSTEIGSEVASLRSHMLAMLEECGFMEIFEIDDATDVEVLKATREKYQKALLHAWQGGLAFQRVFLKLSEEHLAFGVRRLRDLRSAHAKRRIDVSAEEVQAAVERVLEKNPNLSVTQARRFAAAELQVSYDTVMRRLGRK